MGALNHFTCPCWLAAFVWGAQSLPADVGDLRITEVNPATGQVEVTHAGATGFTVGSFLPFCHSFNYGSGIPAGTTFAPGESKSFTVSGLGTTASDLWLYNDSNFASSGSIISGVKFGSSASLGRTSVAVAAGIWPSTGAFLALPRAGESLQPFQLTDASTTNWFSGVPNFGSFAPAEIRVTQIQFTPGSVQLEVTSPFTVANHVVEGRTALVGGAGWQVQVHALVPLAPGRLQLSVSFTGTEPRYFRVGTSP